MKRTGMLISAVALLAMPRPAVAQELELEAQMRRYLAPPELVMRHQRELEITDSQREIITAKISELQSGVLNLQWELQDATNALVETVSGDTVDVASALQQLDRVLETEAAIKRSHMRTLLEIRNTLNAEQLVRLQHIMQELEYREFEAQGRERRPYERQFPRREPIR